MEHWWEERLEACREGERPAQVSEEQKSAWVVELELGRELACEQLQVVVEATSEYQESA